MSRRSLVDGKGESARRKKRALMFPHFDPCAHGREPAGNRNLLRNVLIFPRRKIRTDVHFKSRAGGDSERSFGKIARFFQPNYVGVDGAHITLNGSDLLLFKDDRSIGVTTGKPL